MKISTKGRYGLRILLDIAQNESDIPRTIAEICHSQNLSIKYVSRLIIAFRKAGMIYSVRGAGGGYKLKKLPNEISLLDIIETMEGRISIVECVFCPIKCKDSSNCASREIWAELNEKIRNDLNAITLQDVLNRNTESPDFCI